MAKVILTNCRILVGSQELTSEANVVNLETKREIHDTTTFGSQGWKNKTPGLPDTEGTVEGFLPTTDWNLDAHLFAQVSVQEIPVSFSEDKDEADDVYFLTAAVTYSPNTGAAVGEPHKWSAGVAGKGPLTKGLIIKTGAVTTGSGGGTAFNLGAVTTGKKLYAIVHCIAAAGTSVALKIQSDDAMGMASPVDRITFTTLTAVGSQLATADAPITDTWYRVYWTVVGGSFTIFVGLGIR